MAASNRTGSGYNWTHVADGATGADFGWTARRLIVNGAGDLYLRKPGETSSSNAAGTLFMTGVTAGQVFDVQCDGIGTSTTCTLITAQQ